MATKIKRCLYIGLGGTGMNSLLHVKKMFIDTYGEVPPMIGFLGVDTDRGAYNKTLLAKSGEAVSLSPNEQMRIIVEDARPIYEQNKDAFSWLPSSALYGLTSMKLGAGQLRTNGRFAFTVNARDVRRKISDALNRIQSNKYVDNDRYELLSADVEIFLVFSVCGGTGCGTFLNMAATVRELAPQCKLMGFAVLPHVFRAMARSGMSKVMPNAFGALMDLDYLMHLSLDQKPVALKSLKGDEMLIKERPFNSVVFVDNANANNDVYNHVDQLTELISLGLVTAAGELSSASASVGDNLEKNIREGTMKVANKRAWVAGMGACEILYRSGDLSRIYSIKAAKYLIEQMINSCTDIDAIVNAWIDSEEVHIRENNNNDHVIDFMLSPNPKHELEINEKANPRPEVDEYLRVEAGKDEKISERITDLTTRVNEQLDILISKHINKECGVDAVEKIILGIQAQVEIFLKEMHQEKDELIDTLPGKETNLKNAIEDLKEAAGRVFKFKVKDRVEDVCDAAKIVARQKREIKRRQAAITFYNSLKTRLNEKLYRVTDIKKKLDSVYKMLTDQLASLQNSIGQGTRSFQIDLAQNVANNISVTKSEVLVSDFALKVKGITDGIGAFVEKDTEAIKALMLDYTANLHTARKWASRTIDDMLESLSYEDFNNLINRAIRKSLPVLPYDYNGLFPDENPQDGYFIGVPDKSTCRLTKDLFKNLVSDNADVDVVSIGSTDRIIIYRQLGVLPVYAIKAVKEYQREYENGAAANLYHFDNDLYTRMQREKFSIFPTATNDEDEMLSIWIWGLIRGLIKNEGGKYYFKSEALGDILDDYWEPLGTPYRDEAFETFCRNRQSVMAEYPKIIQEIEAKEGSEAIAELKEDVKAHYMEKYSQLNLTRDRLREKGYEKIQALMRRELEYVRNNF